MREEYKCADVFLACIYWPKNAPISISARIKKKISKTKICKDLDLQRGNFNRYCRDEFQRIDANLILKLCGYLDCDIADLLEIREI